MSIVHVLSGTLVGVNAVEVDVETDLERRLPATVIVGLPAAGVRESADRVRSAILGAGMEFPKQRVVISLSPADLRKDGVGLDLPIAVSVLAAAGKIPADMLYRYMFIGELSLAGDLRPVRGALAYAELAKRLGVRLVCPAQNVAEAMLVPGGQLPLGMAHLRELVAHLRGDIAIPLCIPPLTTTPHPALDMRDIVGQAHARLALEVAAAGGHRLLLVGSPGCGKTMLAARLPGILPAMSAEEALDVVRISSVAGLRAPDEYLPNSRPFRAPHHSISLAGLVGSATMRPGELTLAHRGVLFLDELDQFERATETSLKICMGQTSGGGYGLHGTSMPGSALLVAAMNPCPCGFRGHPTRACVCDPTMLAAWSRRASASPLRPTFDLEVRLEPTKAGEFLPKNPPPECSAAVRARVTAARERQMSRQGCLNSRTDFPRVERVAWTLADLEGVEVSQHHRDAAVIFMGAV